jgi:hypothetical protein
MGDFPGGSDIGLDLEVGGIMREHGEPSGLMAATTPTDRGFTYAANTPYVSREGYLGKLNEKQQSVRALRITYGVRPSCSIVPC